MLVLIPQLKDSMKGKYNHYKYTIFQKFISKHPCLNYIDYGTNIVQRIISTALYSL